MIWKLQRMIAGNTLGSPVLAYTKGRKNMRFIPMSELEQDDLFGKELKIYCHGTIVNDRLLIGERAPDQEW